MRFVCLFLITYSLPVWADEVQGQLFGLDRLGCESAIVQLFDAYGRAASDRVMAQGDCRFALRYSLSGPATIVVQAGSAGARLYEGPVEVGRTAGSLEIHIEGKTKEAPGTGVVSVQQLAHHVPKEAMRLFEKAQKDAAKRRLDAATQKLREATELDSEFGEAYGNLGVYYARMGKLEDSIAATRKAIALGVETSAGYSNLGWALLELHRLQEAEPALKRGAELDVRNPQVNYLYGYILLTRPGREALALQHLEVAEDAIPKVKLLQAQALARLGDINAAEQKLKEYEKICPKPEREQVETWLQRLEKSGFR